MGRSIDGSYAEYVRVPQEHAIGTPAVPMSAIPFQSFVDVAGEGASA